MAISADKTTTVTPWATWEENLVKIQYLKISQTHKSLLYQYSISQDWKNVRFGEP